MTPSAGIFDGLSGSLVIARSGRRAPRNSVDRGFACAPERVADSRRIAA